jgi:trehalose synthase
VVDGKTGFLVEPQDIKGCADRVVTLIKDRKLAANMGKKAKKFIRQKFLITRHLDDYLNLLIEVLDN